ncbi:putative Equilibrative Nucleoside Transporter (ENT) Family Protein [Monocercomonoides exilis]|uniref:putative Equilibrative Nucleoside Transporter (ENT) Family Protein n=1 Tax=Monocercomonoides exilis TaxID=2049356 RepID=UPI003559C47D|nr:putative Equilibrative Nucleoside Transporter (ENT) Family Protein [Monocercomonoides exilis]|eukprot:MONOS_1194.1-p1 / transcript=MONOS_1194.1 / gene=MONOS_1194 / organism=Monocercomonoides_exilis_PA203 / gene_product=Equilibrative Nucleoside Transporter (ENT) Family Protein / transcript_product=Equilibrative Nucleoside Transporter (ENT) Family Protein / location=Mono_scaffold00020:120259-121869(+) / protein_length=435 / sequence_SO=supercontig / SO=protein_coding / is_pseudo=false
MKTEEQVIEEPKDKYNIVYIIFVFIGMAMLCSWNSILSASDFFMKSLPKGTEMSYITSVYNAGCLPVMFIATALSARMNYFYVLCIPIAINTLMMIILPIICTTMKGSAGSLALVMIICFICGICTGLLNTAGFGMGGVFSSRCTQGVMLGQGVVGLISLVPLVLHLCIQGDNTNAVGISFFMFAAVINIIAFISILALKKIPYSKFILNRRNLSNAKTDEEYPLLRNKDRMSYEGVNDDDEPEPEPVPKKTVMQQLKGFVLDLIRIAKKQAPWGFAVFHCYAWTLIVFPTVILHIPPQQGLFTDEWGLSLWWYIKQNIFTVWDFITRWFPNCIKLYNGPMMMNIVSACRIVLVVFLFLCVYVKAFQNLWVVILIYSLFSITNGYHGTMIMANAGNGLTDDADRAMNGSFMSLCLNIGIFSGCMLSMAVSAALK